MVATPSLAESPAASRAAWLGRPGGPLDAGYAQVSNPELPAGYTYFAQLVFHDLTAGGSPRLDLATLYGDDRLRDPARPWRLREGRPIPGTPIRDLPRNRHGVAELGDPRNDRTVMLAQLLALLIRRHNQLADRAHAARTELAFEAARSELLWMYRALVVGDLLPRLSSGVAPGTELPAALADALPRLFELAVGQVGHALVKPRYRLNDDVQAVLFRPAPLVRPYQDLRGQPLIRAGVIAWEHFLPIGDPIVMQHAARIDTRICSPLFFVPAGSGRLNLPRTTLEVAERAGLAGGRRLALACRCPVLAPDQLTPFEGAGDPPLWLYLLCEADRQQHGRRFGSLGSLLLEATVRMALGSCGALPGHLDLGTFVRATLDED